jgi:Uma2 family endonuclease
MAMSMPGESRFRYHINPEDPRAPPSDIWNAMTNEERTRVAAELPSDFTLDFLPPPEGDHHSTPKNAARDALSRYFQRVGRRVYVSSEIAVYYPDEKVFAPDVIAVLDVDPRKRDSWMVDLEGKGIDFVLEIHVHGDRRKDMKKNVVRYASLGIPEYFVFDRRRGILHGFRLAAPDARVYEPLSGRMGRFESRVLGMDLTLEGDKVRFLIGDAPVPEADDLLARLGAALDDAERRANTLEKELEDEQQRRELEQQRRELEQQRRELAEGKLVEALAEIERLKRGG